MADLQVEVELKRDGAPITPTNPLPVEGDFGSDGLTDEELRASPVPVNTGLSLFPLPASQVNTLSPQKDALTEAQLRAAPVDVSTGHAQPLTDSQLRDSPVPVSTGLAPLTNAQLRAAPVPVDIGENINVNVEELTLAFDSRVSELNTTDIPLSANEVFLGEWEQVLEYSTIIATINTDAPSAIQGAMAEFSNDGITVATRSVTTFQPHPSGAGASFSFWPLARYFRIRYVNGPFAQTFLTAEIAFKHSPATTVQAPIAAPTTDGSIASNTKAAMIGRRSDDSGLWQPTLVTPDGRMLVEQRPAVPAVPKTAIAAVSGIGTHQIIPAPGVGKRLAVHYVSFVPRDDGPLVTVRFAGGEPIFHGFAAGKSWRWVGNENEAVEAVLDDSGQVAFTLLYEEIAA